MIDGEDGEQSEVSQSDEVSSASSTDQAAVKMLTSLANKGSSVAAEYESKIKAKMISEEQGGGSVYAEVEDNEVDEEKSDRELEKAVAEALRKKRAQQKEAISDGSVGGGSLVANKQTNSTAVTLASKKIGDDVEMHQPTKSGSWGVFPRPKSISKTFGGGKRVGVGYSEDDDDTTDLSKTRAALLSYRERFGIDVQSEKDHADEISLARETAKRMYARGVYNQAALTLEKVTSWCSSNSPVGGRVFLELGMAYEACGRTSEAITVYQTLCQSRMEDVKKDAQRLLYGIEAMDFMRNEVKAKNFQREKIRDDFVDVSILSEVGGYDEKRYNTAWVDTSKNGRFYKQLTESLVRSTREARQIILAATYSECGIPRPRVVQALRSISREFDSELRVEKEEAEKPKIFIDGKLIAQKRKIIQKEPGSFILASSTQMLENLDGEWRLQLLADKSGDGVKYFNTTESWQRLNCKSMKYALYLPVGFTNVDNVGSWEFQDQSRSIVRLGKVDDGGWLVSILGGSTVLKKQQIMSVDDEMCIMRLGTDEKKKNDDSNIKDYFSVWRKVDKGSYCNDSIIE